MHCDVIACRVSQEGDFWRSGLPSPSAGRWATHSQSLKCWESVLGGLWVNLEWGLPGSLYVGAMWLPECGYSPRSLLQLEHATLVCFWNKWDEVECLQTAALVHFPYLGAPPAMLSTSLFVQKSILENSSALFQSRCRSHSTPAYLRKLRLNLSPVNGKTWLYPCLWRGTSHPTHGCCRPGYFFASRVQTELSVLSHNGHGHLFLMFSNRQVA